MIPELRETFILHEVNNQRQERHLDLNRFKSLQGEKLARVGRYLLYTALVAPAGSCVPNENISSVVTPVWVASMAGYFGTHVYNEFIRPISPNWKTGWPSERFCAATYLRASRYAFDVNMEAEPEESDYDAFNTNNQSYDLDPRGNIRIKMDPDPANLDDTQDPPALLMGEAYSNLATKLLREFRVSDKADGIISSQTGDNIVLIRAIDQTSERAEELIRSGKLKEDYHDINGVEIGVVPLNQPTEPQLFDWEKVETRYFNKLVGRLTDEGVYRGNDWEYGIQRVDSDVETAFKPQDIALIAAAIRISNIVLDIRFSSSR